MNHACCHTSQLDKVLAVACEDRHNGIVALEVKTFVAKLDV